MATERADPQTAQHPMTLSDLIRGAGEDPEREGLRDTPGRVARAFRDMTRGYKERPDAILSTTFESDADELVVLKGVRFVSLCEHHLLPFVGTAAIGYLPSGRVVGLSKLARLVHCFARRLQIQERLTREITAALMEHTSAAGAGVILVAHHSCMGCRGVEQLDAAMVTTSFQGRLKEDAAARAEFFELSRQ